MTQKTCSSTSKTTMNALRCASFITPPIFVFLLWFEFRSLYQVAPEICFMVSSSVFTPNLARSEEVYKAAASYWGLRMTDEYLWAPRVFQFTAPAWIFTGLLTFMCPLQHKTWVRGLTYTALAMIIIWPLIVFFYGFSFFQRQSFFGDFAIIALPTLYSLVCALVIIDSLNSKNKFNNYIKLLIPRLLSVLANFALMIWSIALLALHGENSSDYIVIILVVAYLIFLLRDLLLQKSAGLPKY